jgi:hydroxypyruvate reductase
MATLRSPEQLHDDALAIWQAGVDAVRSDQLVRDNVQTLNEWLVMGDLTINVNEVRRIVAVGAGKAGAGMAAGLVAALGPELVQSKQLAGWMNVPADCVTPETQAQAGPIRLHAARPAGKNEPTAEGVEGAERILELVGSLGPRDLCICLISGGGSALLPAPAKGVSLADKQALTKHLSASGANIEQLNTVRKQLSRIKGGGLAAACRAGQLVSLVISDVLGDPLSIIASGPTVNDPSTPSDALRVLEQFSALEVAPVATQYLRRSVSSTKAKITTRVYNRVLGNNAVAVDSAGIEAEKRGYSHAMFSARELEGSAEEVGVHLAQMAMQMRRQRGPDCLITGGEPTVQLAPANVRGQGGRNQQLVLAALCELLQHDESTLAGITLLSGGTDGEDGPTDAAGAYIDKQTVTRLRALQLDPRDYLRRNDAYTFFAKVGGLIKTGPTHTNVCDVRVLVVDRIQPQPK